MAFIKTTLIWAWITACFLIIPCIGAGLAIWAGTFFVTEELWLLAFGLVGSCFGLGLGATLGIQAMDWLD